MDKTPASLTMRAVAIGRELIRVCDALGQSEAGDHIALALDILSAQGDLLRELEAGAVR